MRSRSDGAGGLRDGGRWRRIVFIEGCDIRCGYVHVPAGDVEPGVAAHLLFAQERDGRAVAQYRQVRRAGGNLAGKQRQSEQNGFRQLHAERAEDELRPVCLFSPIQPSKSSPKNSSTARATPLSALLAVTR